MTSFESVAKPHSDAETIVSIAVRWNIVHGGDKRTVDDAVMLHVAVSNDDKATIAAARDIDGDRHTIIGQRVESCRVQRIDNDLHLSLNTDAATNLVLTLRKIDDDWSLRYIRTSLLDSLDIAPGATEPPTIAV